MVEQKEVAWNILRLFLLLTGLDQNRDSFRVNAHTLTHCFINHHNLATEASV